MKRSDINAAYRRALACFQANGWALPPEPRWDITDLGLGDFANCGLVLINLAEEPEYCEKLMFAHRKQVTPMHCHKKKKEDIICRFGRLAVEIWPAHPDQTKKGTAFEMKKNGRPLAVAAGDVIHLAAGERVTLTPGLWHSFWPETDGCIIGEVSTANDDRHDNFFVDPNIGRFPEIIEDEPATIRLLSEK